MRPGSVLLSVSLIGATIMAAVLIDASWAPYLTALLGLLAGHSYDRFGRIYRSDGSTLERMSGHGLPASARDYLSLRRMAQRLVSRAGRTAIASVEVSHHADRLDRRLGEQETVVREAVASMDAITAAIEQVSRLAATTRPISSSAAASAFSMTRLGAAAGHIPSRCWCRPTSATPAR